MTDITTHLAPSRARNPFVRFGAALQRGFAAYAERASRRDKIVALEAKSDAELAAMGLRREDIPFHVFHDLFYF